MPDALLALLIMLGAVGACAGLGALLACEAIRYIERD